MVDTLVLGTSAQAWGFESLLEYQVLCQISSVGRALLLHSKCRRFEPVIWYQALVAQLDRALAYEAKGYRLESCRGHQLTVDIYCHKCYKEL